MTKSFWWIHPGWRRLPAFDIRLSANYSNYLEMSLRPWAPQLSLVPSPGHLVFNPWENMGIAVNDSHCLVIDGITESGIFPLVIKQPGR